MFEVLKKKEFALTSSMLYSWHSNGGNCLTFTINKIEIIFS